MKDDTEELRRQLMMQQPACDLNLLRQGWDTAQLTAEFEVLGFMAPFVVVRRKSDGVKGSMEFVHYPRFYFNWVPDERDEPLDPPGWEGGFADNH